MQLNKYISYALCTGLFLALTSCGTRKKMVSPQPPQAPSWHTCLIQGARAVVTTDEDKLSASVTMQTVRDSMLVMSVMPMLGMEMLRIEATPTEVVAIDKIHGQYAVASYSELNRQLTPELNWDILQQLCSAELPTGSQRARLMYNFNGETIELVVDYTPRQIDVPVRVVHQRIDKYTKVDISKWL